MKTVMNGAGALLCLLAATLGAMGLFAFAFNGDIIGAAIIALIVAWLIRSSYRMLQGLDL